jgi:uncharacterized protein
MNDQLADVVRSCVNQVGVNLNTASVHLLSYVSGLSAATAGKIVEQRNQVGAFTSRNDLFNIPRLGKKTYEQCAGFLRIPEAQHPLDNSAVHPERYGLVEKMAKDTGIPLKDLIGRKDLKSLIDLNKYVSSEIGLPTLNDIISELEKPGRDPRKSATILEFDPNVRKPDDLIPGMVLPGIITNITAFGAFVDGRSVCERSAAGSKTPSTCESESDGSGSSAQANCFSDEGCASVICKINSPQHPHQNQNYQILIMANSPQLNIN